MASSSKGNKRTCPNCETRFYDLGQKQVTCPKCGTETSADDLALESMILEEVEAKPTPAPDALEATVDDILNVDPKLNEDKDEDDQDEDQGLMEDASDLSNVNDEMSSVVESSHIERAGGVGEDA